MKQNTEQLKKKFEERFPADYEGFGGLYDPNGSKLRKTLIVNPEKIWNFFLPYITKTKAEVQREVIEDFMSFYQQAKHEDTVKANQVYPATISGRLDSEIVEEYLTQQSLNEHTCPSCGKKQVFEVPTVIC